MAFWDRERITLVVEEDALRLMGVRRGAVTRWGSAPLPPGTVAPDGSVAEPARLAELLGRLWGSQAVGGAAPRDGLLVAIPGNRVPSRLVRLASLPDQPEQLSALARELLPHPDAIHAWQVVSHAGQPGLFVVAPPAALLEGYVAALSAAGLSAAVMDLKPLALVRGVGQRQTVIVDGERSRGAVIVVSEALPRLVRFLSLDAPLLASPEEKAIRLVEVLHEAIQRFNRESEGSTLHPAVPIFLSGSLAEQPLLRDAVRSLLGRPLGQLAPPLQLPGDLPLSQFVTNVGLALKEL